MEMETLFICMQAISHNQPLLKSLLELLIQTYLFLIRVWIEAVRNLHAFRVGAILMGKNIYKRDENENNFFHMDSQ